MNDARADALAARSQLAMRGWIPRNAESFRHLPPPAAAVWLGDVADPSGSASELAPDGGWTLHPMAPQTRGSVDARWLDARDPAQRAALFAGLPQPGDEEAAPFSWAHRALVRQGLRLRIAPAAGDDGAVRLKLGRLPGAHVEAPLLVIELLPGARCVLLESHERDGLEELGRPRDAIVQNLQVHVLLAEGASLQHLRIAMPAAGDRIAHHVRVTLERDACYDQCLLAGGSDYHLQRTVLELLGDRASARTAAALLAAGSALEEQVRVRHGAARTRSSVDALALGSGAARMVANAHTCIDAGCSDAQARQRLAGVPTGGQPRLVLRPHLEIHHDQVQAQHGATWGALPEDALFHARQRGLDQHTAKAMIVQGMARAVLARSLDQPELLESLGVEALLAAAVQRHLAHAGEPRPERNHG
jgi:Fe-S cluster assembly protein SufD